MSETVVEFFNMGGYALYVWGSFGVTAVLMAAEPLLLRSRRKALLRRISRLVRIKAEERHESQA